MRVKQRAGFALVTVLLLAGCGGGPGTGATFDPDAPGAEADAGADEETSTEQTRQPVRGRDDPSEMQEADLDALVERACGRAVTPSGRYSQSGYDRGVKEGMEAGATEQEMIDGIDALCGDEIREAQGEG